MAKLCEIKANEVSRGAKANDLKAKLGELKQTLDEIANLIANSADKIFEHCSELRRGVDLSSEKLIESINSYEMELIAQIDEYEQDLIAKKEISDEYKTRLKKLIKETNEIYANSMDYLNQFELKDEDLNQAMNKLNNFQENVNHERELFVNKIFNSHVLNFVENANEYSCNIIGTFEDESHLAYQRQLDNLKIYDLEDEINYDGFDGEMYVNSGSLSAQFLANEKICVAYQSYEDFFLGIFDSDLENSNIKNFGEFVSDKRKLARLNSFLILCLINKSRSKSHSPGESTITKLDDNLDELKKITFDYEIKAVEGFASQLYCLSSTHKVNKQIYVYDEILIQVMSIGQHEDLTKPFYISNSFKKMMVSDMYYVFLDGKQVVLMNRQNGLVDKKFNHDSFDLRLHNDGLSAFKYDGVNCNLVKYDFDGNSQFFSLDKASIDGKIKKSMKLIDYVNGKFIFFDKDDCSLIF
jgi:hypothetical protein